MENEEELNRIFAEKLFIRKRSSISADIQTSASPALGTIDETVPSKGDETPSGREEDGRAITVRSQYTAGSPYADYTACPKADLTTAANDENVFVPQEEMSCTGIPMREVDKNIPAGNKWLRYKGTKDVLANRVLNKTECTQGLKSKPPSTEGIASMEDTGHEISQSDENMICEGAADCSETVTSQRAIPRERMVRIDEVPQVFQVESTQQAELPRHDRIKEMEREFDKFRRIHLDSLKFKSKIYRFIYSELSRLEEEGNERIRMLEKENKELKERIACLEKREKDFRAFVRKSAMAWRDKVIEGMKKYKREIENELIMKHKTA